MTYEHRRGAEYQKNRAKALERDEYRCVDCGVKVGKKSDDIPTAYVHHIAQISDRGSNEMGNLVTLCKEHHHERHGWDYEPDPWTPEPSGFTPNETDMEILREIVENGRATTTLLSQEIGVTRTYASDRVRRLREHSYLTQVAPNVYDATEKGWNVVSEQ